MNNFLFLPRALAAAVADTSFALALGFVVAALWLDHSEDKPLRARLRSYTVYCLITLFVTLSVQAFLLTATMIGSAELASIRSEAAAVLTGTHAGRVVVIESIVPVVLLVLFFIRYGRRSRVDLWSALGFLVALAAIRSAIGHSADDGDFTLPEFVQAIHLTSTAIWAGCVIAAGLVVLPALMGAERLAAMLQFTRRLSRTVTFALGFILLTGIYNSYRGLGGSLAPLAGTRWGKLLDLNLVLICVAVVLGALNRRLIGGDRTLAPDEYGRLATLMRVEAGIMLLILAVSAFLANSPPASSL